LGCVEERGEPRDFVGEIVVGEIVFVAGFGRRRFRGEGEGVVNFLEDVGD